MEKLNEIVELGTAQWLIWGGKGICNSCDATLGPFRWDIPDGEEDE